MLKAALKSAFTKWRSDKGMVVSTSAHAVLLAATLVAFSRTPPFEDAQESVPVEIVTDAQLNQIIKGEKTAKVVKPTPKVDKLADIAATKPLPPTPEAKRDVPTPPPPLKRLADPGEDDKPEQKEPQKVAALPPPRPTPEPPKVEPKPEPPAPPVRPQAAKPAPQEKPEPDDAEPVRPKPVERPKEIAKEQPKPEPKPEPKHAPTPPQPPKPQLKVDEVAKLLEQSKTPEPKAKADKPASKPKSGDEDSPKSSLDLTAISKIIDHDKPARTAATGAHVQQVAALGSPNANAAKMSPSLWAGLDALMQERYRQCWTYLGIVQGQKYVPQVRVRFQQDGSLAAEPSLVNPPSDPAMRGLAESAMRAVRKCDPMRIPAQYLPYYEQWKARVVRFDPDEMT